MQWYTTYTAYPAGPDLALVVEQDVLMSRWRFSVKSDGALLFRSAAEWATPEDAQSAAEQWLATPPKLLVGRLMSLSSTPLMYVPGRKSRRRSRRDIPQHSVDYPILF